MYRVYPQSVYHIAKSAEAQARISEAIQRLQQLGQLPDKITERADVLTHSAKVSRKTLYKSHNKPIWHPQFMVISEAT